MQIGWQLLKFRSMTPIGSTWEVFLENQVFIRALMKVPIHLMLSQTPELSLGSPKDVPACPALQDTQSVLPPQHMGYVALSLEHHGIPIF